MEVFLFALLAVVSLLSAAGMILSRNAVHSALFLILNFGCVALLFLMLDAPFISMVQIAVYAGAIMVLFLFVIMLLGAEQATETDTRKLRWVSSVAVVLPVVFVLALGGTLFYFALNGGIEFSEPQADKPLIRFVHAADIEEPVNITISNDDEDFEDVTFEDVIFADVTDFTELDAGEFDVAITAADGEQVMSASVSLEAGQVLTVVAHNDGFYEIQNSFEATGDDKARVTFLNLFTEEPIKLVDIGRERVLHTDSTDSSNPYRGNITDVVVLEEVPYGEVIASEDLYSEGTFNWGFYAQRSDGTWYRLAGVNVPGQNEWVINGNTDQTVILVSDYSASSEVPRVLDSAQKVLTFETNEPFGAPGDIGRVLFVDYLLPVNLVGFLLLVALIGVIVLTRPEGVAAPRRSSINRRRKVSRPLTSVISQQTGRDVVEDTPRLDEPSSGD